MCTSRPMAAARCSRRAAKCSRCPPKTGRIVKVAGNSGVRYREARFLPDGKNIVLLSTESGETEFWQYPANGIGARTTDPEHQGASLGRHPLPRRTLARPPRQGSTAVDLRPQDQDTTSASRSRRTGDFTDLNWSPDSRWLAYVETAANSFQQIQILNVEAASSRRSRRIATTASIPAGARTANGCTSYPTACSRPPCNRPGVRGSPIRTSPGRMKIYELALTARTCARLSAAPTNCIPIPTRTKTAKEEQAAPKEPKQQARPQSRRCRSRRQERRDKADEKNPEVQIDFADLAARLSEVPIPPGNYRRSAGHREAPLLARTPATNPRRRCRTAVPGHRQQGRRVGHRDRRRQELRDLAGPQEDAARQGA